MKLNKNVVWHVYKWIWGLEISKCLPLPWKPQMRIKIVYSELLLRDHLSYKAIFYLSQRCPLNTGLTVFLSWLFIKIEKKRIFCKYFDRMRCVITNIEKIDTSKRWELWNQTLTEYNTHCLLYKNPFFFYLDKKSW
jgi:hypothetical protein